MRIAAEYKGYAIVETDWLGKTDAGIAPVYAIRGLRERPFGPILSTVEECEEYIEEELAGRAMVDAVLAESAEGETWKGRIRLNGSSQVVTVPAETMRRLGLEIGDEVRITVVKGR